MNEGPKHRWLLSCGKAIALMAGVAILSWYAFPAAHPSEEVSVIKAAVENRLANQLPEAVVTVEMQRPNEASALIETPEGEPLFRILLRKSAGMWDVTHFERLKRAAN